MPEPLLEASAISLIWRVPWSKERTLRARIMPGNDADDAGDQADVQPCLVDSTEVEGLLAALGCEQI